MPGSAFPNMLIDDDGNGIDDRVERAAQGAWDRMVDAARGRFPGLPLPDPPPHASPVLATGEIRAASNLGAACAEISAASGSAAGKANPVVATKDGYEYRAVPAVAWAAASGFGAAEGVLAAILQSEAPDLRRFPAYGWAIGECVLNQHAAVQAKTKTGERLPELYQWPLRDATHPEAAGHLGRQPGRWCSSIQLPTVRALVAARQLLALGHGRLVSSTARRWIDPQVQDRMAVKARDRAIAAAKALRKQGAPERVILAALAHRTLFAHEVVNKWGREGWQAIHVVVDAQNRRVLDPYVLLPFEFVGAGKSSTTEAQIMVSEGRRRWKVAVPPAPTMADAYQD